MALARPKGEGARWIAMGGNPSQYTWQPRPRRLGACGPRAKFGLCHIRYKQRRPHVQVDIQWQASRLPLRNICPELPALDYFLGIVVDLRHTRSRTRMRRVIVYRTGFDAYTCR